MIAHWNGFYGAPVMISQLNGFMEPLLWLPTEMVLMEHLL